MLALLFEMQTKPNQSARYLTVANALRPSLASTDGFLWIDRYRSIHRPEVLLSHSLWRNEAALTSWRTFPTHHFAQVEGREKIFTDYRLRVAHVTEEIMPGKSSWSAGGFSSYRADCSDPKRYIAIVRSAIDLSDHDAFLASADDFYVSISNDNEYLSTHTFESSGTVLLQHWLNDDLNSLGLTSIRICEVERDYTMHDRREAPQFYRTVGEPRL